jgi:methylenetetrahydrofolate reductase (NADPH)
MTDLDRRPGCPKRMVFGPCGGVRPSGDCEVAGVGPCSFLGQAAPEWPGRLPAGERPASPRVVIDLHVRPRDLQGLRSVARELRGACDGVLVGDHAGVRNDFPPSFVASVLLEEGVTPWVTLACRDRNRVALAAECAALATLGVAGVLCVTGDWQGAAGDLHEQRVYDLDALRLVGLARDHGLVAAVAAAPASPPAERRPARLASKVRAGAQVCFVNHAGGAGPVGRFIEQARLSGADVPYVPCVAAPPDARLRHRLGALPGVVVSPAAVEGSASADPVGAGTDEGRAMLAVPGVTGVNLSGVASERSEIDSARVMAAIGRRLLEVDR